MPNSNKRGFMNRHVWLVYVISAVSVAAVTYYQLWLGIIMAILLIISFFYSLQIEQKLFKKQQDYILSLSHRIEKVAEVALLKMPIGIILYDEKLKIEWTNPYMNKFAEEDSLVGTPLHRLSEKLDQMMHENKTEGWVRLGDYEFEVTINLEEHLLYLFDRTEQYALQKSYEEDQTVMAIIFLDNYEEITQNMDDTVKSMLNSKVTSLLNNWSNDYGIYLKRTSQDRFLAVATKKILQQLEGTKFEILDKVRELEIEHKLKNPITLSIGVGYGDLGLQPIGELAQSGLDLALGRGGDQVVIKDDQGKVRFYGGKTSPMEKRTRVRARVISHALTELVRASDKVIIMGHRSPDMDSLGSSIGILNIARANDVQGYIVFDEDDNITGVQRIIEALTKEESLWRQFISSEEAEDLITPRSLIVVVDTHKPSMVASESLLYKSEYKVIIDHHRRGEDFIENPTLVYMEPYASSTAELVTELLEYQPSKIKLKMLEATALLAGIIVDTKSFTLRTGSRTFDAASYLRSKGADTVLVQRFMKEDLDVYVKRSKLIEKTYFYRDSIAITKSDSEEIFDQVIIAQAADTLLTMSGVIASFVISPLASGKIGVSARSLGDVNVQIIMEKMNGGGHLTNAATQISDTTTEETETLLKDLLDEYFEGRD